MDTNGWSRAEKYVFEELERLSGKMDQLDEKITNLRVDVAAKGAIWGAVSGTIVAALSFFFRRVP